MTPPLPSLTTFELLGWVLVGLLVAVVVVGYVAVGLSVRGKREDRRIEAVEDSIRTELLDRLGRDEPAWGTWLDGLSRRERDVLETQTDQYLRLLTGSDRDRLHDLATRLDAGQRIEQPFATEDRIDRLGALSWLALLNHEVDVDRLVEHCSDDPAERAAVGRVLYEHREAIDGAASIGTRLLTSAGTALPMYGTDTLFRLNQTDPTPLLTTCASQRGDWTVDLLAQALETLTYCDPAGGDAPIEWVLDCLDCESPAVREAALGVVGTYGWRAELRAGVDVERAVNDPVPSVRRAAYREFSAWNDETVQVLVAAAATETDDRARLLLARELSGRLRDVTERLPPGIAACLDWAEAEEAAKAR
jgi:hypothetical protein